MGTVLRPVGPEPAQKYWVRRLAVISVAVVMLAVIVALIVNGTSSGSAVQATPPPPTMVAAETPSPTPTPTATPYASASPTTAGVTATPSTTVTTASPSGLVTTAPSSTATTVIPSAAVTTVTPSATVTTAIPSAAATESSPPALAACASSNLRPTLTGKQQLAPKQPNTFRLSLINGSGQTCSASVTRNNFELKIYSGTDRIWSTKDCASAVKAVTKKLDPEQALEWSLTWNGRRSRTGCQSRPEIPRPGTYYATAQLAGAEPVRLRMILTG